MTKRVEVPQFGPLQGVRVAHSSVSIAGPFAVDVMAEWGADVIWIENPNIPDLARAYGGNTVKKDRRNQREIALDLSSPEGKEVFLRMVKDLDIFLECSRAGQYEKWGLSDDVLWEANPKLIIVHISGFGQTCDPAYRGRSSYDPIAQAYGGLMYLNKAAGRRYAAAKPNVADYYTAMYACSSALAAYIRMKETGQGESIDIAQYEVVLRMTSLWDVDAWNNDKHYDAERDFEGNNNTAGWRSYECKDGNSIYVLVLGGGVVKNAFEFFDLPYGVEGGLAAGTPVVFEGTPMGDLLTETLINFCAEHDAAEAERILCEQKIPAAQILEFSQMLDHPLFKSRNSIIEYENTDGTTFTAPCVVPTFQNNPGKVWRGGSPMGVDNHDILDELGYSEDEIAELYDKKIIKKEG